jgi:hypothetical protein
MVARKEGIGRHLEGWELGVIAVTAALLGTLLFVPLRVAPEDLPLPIADERSLAQAQQIDEEMALRVVPLLERELAHAAASDGADAATHGGEPATLYDLRAFGEAFRAYGNAEASSDMYEAVRLRKKLLEATARARSIGDRELLGLRAYEKRRFVEELARWEHSGTVSDEMTGLGGSFLSLAERYGWTTDHRLAMGDAVRGIFFERRWNELTGLTEAPYALSVDQSRVLYRYWLMHPPVETAVVSFADACRLADEWRLRKVTEIARFDPAYPAALARGVLLYRLGRYPAAADALRDHLRSASGGAFALRARNYLAEATARAAALQP